MPNRDEPLKRVTLRDIAKELGVSHSTVSLALRNHSRISAAVRERVHQVAQEMGYRPDPMLAALASYRRGRKDQAITASLAWINAWSDPDELRRHREFDSYWVGASATAVKFGYRLEEFRLGDTLTADRLHQILSARGIRGILLPPTFDQPDWSGFPWEEYSVVRFGRSLHEPCCHVVTVDQVANTMLAIQSMSERGYRRIGFVGYDHEFTQGGHLFELGYAGGQRMIGEDAKLPPLLLGRDGPEEYQRCFAAWLGEHEPDAVFTTLSAMPDMLKKAGLRVPGDIGLAATTLIDTGVDAGIDQHPEEIGRVGFLMLNSLINASARGIPLIFRQQLVEGSWVDGSHLPRRGPES